MGHVEERVNCASHQISVRPRHFLHKGSYGLIQVTKVIGLGWRKPFTIYGTRRF